MMRVVQDDDFQVENKHLPDIERIVKTNTAMCMDWMAFTGKILQDCPDVSKTLDIADFIEKHKFHDAMDLTLTTRLSCGRFPLTFNGLIATIKEFGNNKLANDLEAARWKIWSDRTETNINLTDGPDNQDEEENSAPDQRSREQLLTRDSPGVNSDGSGFGNDSDVESQSTYADAENLPRRQESRVPGTTVLCILLLLLFGPLLYHKPWNKQLNATVAASSHGTQAPNMFHTELMDDMSDVNNPMLAIQPLISVSSNLVNTNEDPLTANHTSVTMFDCESTPGLVYNIYCKDPVPPWFNTCDNSSLRNLTLQGNLSFEQSTQLFSTNLPYSLRVLEFKSDHFCKEFKFSSCTARPLFENLNMMIFSGIISECRSLFKYLSECPNYLKRFKIRMENMLILPRGVHALDALRVISGNPIDFMNVTGVKVENSFKIVKSGGNIESFSK